MKLELSDAQRLILFNQYRILEFVDPDHAETYATVQKALMFGYEEHYADAVLWLADRDVLTREESREAMNIMGMFVALKRSYEDLKDKSGIDTTLMTFTGFDGNHEAKLMGYARFLVHDKQMFEELKPGGDDFNSHGPFLGMYQAMLAKWESLGEPYQMSKEQIVSVTKAGTEGRRS